MRKVSLELSRGGYDILIGAGLLARADVLLRDMGYTDKLVIVTDSRVKSLYGEDLKKNLQDGGFEVLLLEVPQGEEQKSLDTAGRLYNEMTDFYAERSTPVVALGGGVIGDLAGFVAATYMRGVPLVQMPTTLLAQGDSSIGGKVAVNHGELKNKIGAFYHPRVTISDLNTIRSLSPREISNGMAEIIKHGVILDGKFFDYIDETIEEIKTLDDEVMEKVVSRSAEIKAGVVEKDELDLGMRNILNCGHTVGHAVESVSGLTFWHGEAVAVGMLIEAAISKEMGILSGSDLRGIKAVVEKAGLPTRLPVLQAGDIIGAMKHDKKNVGGRIKFVLPEKIGKVTVRDDVDLSLVERVLGEWNEQT
jgi:3-dehydroquinate synthase